MIAIWSAKGTLLLKGQEEELEMNSKSQLASSTTVCLSGYPNNHEYPFFFPPHRSHRPYVRSQPVNCPLAQRPESLSGTQSSPIRASRDLATCERVEHLPGPLTSNTHTPSSRTGTENHTKDSHLKKGSVGNTAGPYQFSGAVWQKPEGFRAL